MYRNFPLFQSHLDLAHSFWKRIVKPGDFVVDATCGNGHDSILLAEYALEQNANGKLFVFDIQKQALDVTKSALQEKLNAEQMDQVTFFELSHAKMHEVIPEGSLKLIVYNLGYLPGGDKKVTTKVSSTIESVSSGLKLLKNEGAISITCYPGHLEGAEEEKMLLQFCQDLPPSSWYVSYHQSLNRKNAPSLLLIQSASLL